MTDELDDIDLDDLHPEQDVKWSPYKRLAAAVIKGAIDDFGPKIITRAKEHPSVSVQRHIEAGEFLLEREDEVALFWFNLAECDIYAYRASLKKKKDWPTYSDLVKRLDASRKMRDDPSMMPKPRKYKKRMRAIDAVERVGKLQSDGPEAGEYQGA